MSIIEGQQLDIADLFQGFVNDLETKGPKVSKETAEQALVGRYNELISKCMFLPKEQAEECVLIADRLSVFSERSIIGQLVKAVRRGLTLQNSEVNESSISTEPLHQKPSIWRFVSASSDGNSGTLYTFKMKSSHYKALQPLLPNQINPGYVPTEAYYQLIIEYRDQQLPAVEIMIDYILSFQKVIAPDILTQLGYSFEINEDGCSMTLPDKWALEVRWNVLQKMRSDVKLPDLRIVEGEKIEPDLAFARAYRRRGLVLAKGEEFIHDHVHILAKIARCVNTPELAERMNVMFDRVISSFLDAIKKLKIKMSENDSSELKLQIPQLEFILGFFVDFASAGNSFVYPYFFEPESMKEAVREILRSKGIVNPPEDINVESIGVGMRTPDEFLNLNLGRDLFVYVWEQPDFHRIWRKRFGYSLTGEKFAQLLSLVHTENRLKF